MLTYAGMVCNTAHTGSQQRRVKWASSVGMKKGRKGQGIQDRVADGSSFRLHFLKQVQSLTLSLTLSRAPALSLSLSLSLSLIHTHTHTHSLSYLSRRCIFLTKVSGSPVITTEAYGCVTVIRSPQNAYSIRPHTSAYV